MNVNKEYEEQKIASYWNTKFKEAMVTKAPYTDAWSDYWNAYRGDYFKNQARPDYKSDLVSNYIFSIIETIRPIMLDNDPKFQTMPRNPNAMAYSTDIDECLMYEWDRENMNRKLYRELITMLVTGTSVFFVPWNSKEKQVNAIPVDVFNIFPDPLATTVDDAEYIIYASYKHAGRLARMFPKHKERLERAGGAINYSELVHENDRNSQITNQVLVLEVHTKGYDEYNRAEGFEYSEKGRVITVCPEIGIVLQDKENPYKDGKFPFVLLKDYDVPGKFWGEGEVAQLISPQKYMNELNNAILDNAKSTANMPWIVDKNAGIAQGKITSRPGLILRANPGTRVDRLQPPSMPSYVINAVEQYKQDMEQISGIFDTLKGNSETGVYTAQGILALQEAGQARIRLKVKILEDALGKMGQLWYSRMQQFWKEERWLRLTMFDGTYDMKKFRNDALKYNFDIKIMAGSTMPHNKGAMLDLMIRLAQTQMPDGSMLVDRQAVAEYLPAEVKNSMMQRMQDGQTQVNQQIEQLTQQQEQLMQELQAFQQQDQADDQQTMAAIEQITQAIEQINQQIGAVEQNNAKMEAEKQKAEQEQKIKTEAYNSGYSDAESLSQPQQGDITEDLGEDMDNMGLGLPADIMNGLEQLSDDELAVLLESNPELADLLQE